MSFAERRDAVLREIARDCARCGRDPADVSLLAVSKKHPADAVREAFAAGQMTFGENRVQELVQKAEDVSEPVEWHFIGSVQTNKVNALLRVERLALLHSPDRTALADAPESRLADSGRKLAVLLQIDATSDDTKHGCSMCESPALLEHVVSRCPHLDVQGLMAMGPREGDPRPVFDKVAALRDKLRKRSGLELPTLSLGMSGDLEAAIAAGSTLVRVGTALFGPRE